MIFTNSTTNYTNIETQKSGQKPASKCIRYVYEIQAICRALQALYSPQRCELIEKKNKKKKKKKKKKKH